MVTCSYGSSSIGNLFSVTQTSGKNRREKPAQWQFTCSSQDLSRIHFEPQRRWYLRTQEQETTSDNQGIEESKSSGSRQVVDKLEGCVHTLGDRPLFPPRRSTPQQSDRGGLEPNGPCFALIPRLRSEIEKD